MNLRCTYCQTPFTVGRLEKLAAIQRLQAENLQHYDVFCPRCRRANSVSRQRLEVFTPGWQEGLKTLETEAANVEKGRAEPASTPQATKPAPAPVEATRNRHAPRPVAAAPSRADSKPAATASPKGKPAAKKADVKAKPTAKKTVAKAKPAAKKPVAKAKPAAKAKKTASKKK
jgi:phage FluMu protein Com